MNDAIQAGPPLIPFPAAKAPTGASAAPFLMQRAPWLSMFSDLLLKQVHPAVLLYLSSGVCIF